MLNDYHVGSGKTQQLLFGYETGRVLSRVQGTIVSTGTFLQNSIKILCQGRTAILFQQTLRDPNMRKTYKADMVILDKEPEAVELKLGYEFDTKKAAKEVADIVQFARLLGIQKGVVIQPVIVLFNAENLQDMEKFKAGSNGIILRTGREQCDRLRIDYDCVRNELASMQKARRNLLLQELKQAVEKDNLNEGGKKGIEIASPKEVYSDA